MHTPHGSTKSSAYLRNLGVLGRGSGSGLLRLGLLAERQSTEDAVKKLASRSTWYLIETLKTYLALLDGVGLTAAVSEASAAGSVAAASGSLAASVEASAAGVSVATAGVSVAASSVALASSTGLASSTFFSSGSFLSFLPPSRAPKMEARLLVADFLPSSALTSLAASSLASSLGASVVAAAAGVSASVAAAGVSSATLGVSSAFFSSAFSSFLATTGVKDARVVLYFSDSTTVLASSLASAIFSLS